MVHALQTVRWAGEKPELKTAQQWGAGGSAWDRGQEKNHHCLHLKASLPLTSLDFLSLVRPHYLQRIGRGGGCNCFLRVRSINGNSDPLAGCSLRLQVAIFHLCFKF